MPDRSRFGIGRRHHRMTEREIAESDRLRDCVLRSTLSDAEIARAAGCMRATVRGWLDRHRHLAPHHQAKVRSEFSGETGGPG